MIDYDDTVYHQYDTSCCFYYYSGLCQRSWEFLCNDTRLCIDRHLVCDHTEHCPGGQDEHQEHCQGKYLDLNGFIIHE